MFNPMPLSLIFGHAEPHAGPADEFEDAEDAGGDDPTILPNARVRCVRFWRARGRHDRQLCFCLN